MKKMKQVDFEHLTFLAERLEKKQKSQYILRNAEIENFKLFMEMMGKSSSFAHKAHKELRKFNKVEDQQYYKYRSLPYTYCMFYISGVDNGINGLGVSSGILEWCTDEDDAINLFEKMRMYSQFSNLRIESYNE